MQPLFRWRMRRAELVSASGRSSPTSGAPISRSSPSMLARIRDEGPKVAGDFEKRATKRWFWGWSNAKRGLEWLFWSERSRRRRVALLRARLRSAGACAARRHPRAADAERPRCPPRADRRAVRALGVANRRDIRDYFRTALSGHGSRALPELVEAGELVPVRIERLKDVYYCAAGRARAQTARATRPCSRRSIRSVWQRQRTHDLFGFHYRLEIYTPAPLRKHGYYVLPFLLGDRLVARVDLKSDRKKDACRSSLFTPRPTRPRTLPKPCWASCVCWPAGWGLARIAMGRRGNFANKLRNQL
jgi:uncharacterized protein YcaQ